MLPYAVLIKNRCRYPFQTDRMHLLYTDSTLRGKNTTNHSAAGILQQLLMPVRFFPLLILYICM